MCSCWMEWNFLAPLVSAFRAHALGQGCEAVGSRQSLMDEIYCQFMDCVCGFLDFSLNSYDPEAVRWFSDRTHLLEDGILGNSSVVRLFRRAQRQRATLDPLVSEDPDRTSLE
eukprot:Sdes_comp8921_c0_seq1m332